MAVCSVLGPCHCFDISLGSIVTYLRYGGICSDIITANLLMSLSVKEFLLCDVMLAQYMRDPMYVCLSFRPSQFSTLSKQLIIGSCKQ